MGGKKAARQEEEADDGDQEAAVASKAPRRKIKEAAEDDDNDKAETAAGSAEAGQKKKNKEKKRAAEAEQAALASEGDRNKKKRKAVEELEVEQEADTVASEKKKNKERKRAAEAEQAALASEGDGNKKKKKKKPTNKLTLKEKKRAKKQALQTSQGVDSAMDSAASAVGSDEAPRASKENLKAHIAGLPFSAKEADIKKFFKKCGKILDVELVGRRLGKATLTLADEAGLDSVLKMNGEKYGESERWLVVSGKESGKARSAKGKGKEEGKGKSKDKGGGKSKDKGGGKSKDKGWVNAKDIREFEVFVAGFPTSVGEAGLRKLFSTSGDIDRILLPSDKSGSPKGFACISFTSMEGMEKALELEQTDFCGEVLLVRKRVEHKKGQSKGKGEGKSSTGKGKLGSRDFEVFVGGLPYSTEESVIRRDFEECGEVFRFSMPLDDEGNHQGLAFVSYASAEGMEKALEHHETFYGGVTIRVQKADAPRGGGFARGDKGQGKASQGRGTSQKDTGFSGVDGGSHAAFANSQGVLVESTGKRQTFDDDESDG